MLHETISIGNVLGLPGGDDEAIVPGVVPSFTTLSFAETKPPTLQEFHDEADSYCPLIDIKALTKPPASKPRKIARFAYFPCIGPWEVNERAAVAGVLARKGWQCIIGDGELVWLNGFGDFPPGVVMFNSAALADAKSIHKAHSYGHKSLLHSRGGLLCGNQWAHEMADARVDEVLGGRLPCPLFFAGIQDFRTSLRRLFKTIIGGPATPEIMEELHKAIDVQHPTHQYPTEPREWGVETVAAAAQKLWARDNVDLPWFNVMTAWQARHVGEETKGWSIAVEDSVVAERAQCGVYPLARNVWAVRAAQPKCQG